MAAAFGGVELGRVPSEDGTIGHAEIRVAGTVLPAFDQRPGWPETPALLRVLVEDVPAEEGFRRLAEPAHVQAMSQAQETLDHELSGQEHGTASPVAT